MTRPGAPTGSGRVFPATRLSVVGQLAADDPGERERAWDLLVRAYWRPVYATLRLTHGVPAEDAEDLTQEFFLEAMAKGWLSRFDPARARFRTWLRTCLRGFVGHERQAAGRLKRGGGLRPVPVDAAGIEADLAALAPGEDPFDHEWVRSVLALALERLDQRCRDAGHPERWEVFRRYDLAGAEAEPRPTYRDVAEALGLPVTQVTNHLHWARGAFREEVLGALRALTGTDEEFRDEAAALLGARP